MKTFFLTSLSLVSLCLSACVGPAYQLPPGYNGPLATIKNSGKELSPLKAEVFNVYKIDGCYSHLKSPMATPYGGGPFVTLQTSEAQIPARKTQIEIVGRDAYAADGVAIMDKIAGGERKTVSGTVELTPKPGGTYIVRGQLDKATSQVWIEDAATGKVVTSKVLSK